MTAAADAPVVAGVSGSAESLSVVRVAAQEAAAHNRPLCVLHAFDWDAALAAPSVVGPRAEAEQAIEQALAAAAEVAPDVAVRGRIVEGSAVKVLLRRSESAFLVAVGDGGMSRRDCVPADTAALQVASRAGCPVLVVRLDPPPVGPVLVGLDGSAASRTALALAVDCAGRHGGRLRAVRVVEPEDDLADVETLATELADLVTRYGHPEVSIEREVLRGEPGPVLVEQSRSARLVVVGARGEEARRGMIGAVSQSLLYHAPAPVIFVRGVTHGPIGGT